jgi:hypothetical protein
MDAEHPRIGKQSTNLVLTHEAVATEELQALVDEPAGVAGRACGACFSGSCSRSCNNAADLLGAMVLQRLTSAHVSSPFKLSQLPASENTVSWPPSDV